MMNCKEDTMLRKYKNLIIKEKKQTPIRMTSFLKGDVAELKAAAWLMEQGFFVFTNVSKSGAIDLIAVREKLGNCVIYPIDVKTMVYNIKKKSSRKINGYNTHVLTPVQKEMNVRLLYYYSHSGKFMFQDEEEKLLPKGVAGKGVHRFAFDVKE